MKEILGELKDAFEEFKAKNDERYNGMEKEVLRLKRIESGLLGPDRVVSSNAPFSVKVGDRIVPVLAKTDRLSAHYPAPQGEEGAWSLGAYARAAMGISGAVVSSPALVPEYIGTQIIDLVRAASVVVEAGAGTINIDGPTNLAKITADPVVYQHTEATDDIQESTPTLAAVPLNPKALVALIPLSMEVVADSPNLNAVLDMAIAGAIAAKLDALCLATILADTDIPDSATGQSCATWAGTMAAVGAALALNQKLPTALIGNVADFIARAAQLASTAGSWLGKPPVLSGMIELPTTGINAGTAVLGDFLRGFAIAVRQQLRIEVIRFAKPTLGSHLMVCHARMDGVVLQPARLFKQLTTVI